MIKALIFFITFVSLNAFADVHVAFLTATDSKGQLIVLEKGGRFFHTAISYNGHWLHVHPLRGVELTSDLSDLGVIETILSSEEFNEPTIHFFESQRGKTHNLRESWHSSRSTYCSKLVGQWFGLQPTIMNFDSDIWQGIEGLPRGKEGLSPDDAYHQLLSMGFREGSRSCGDLLVRPGVIKPYVLRAKAL